MIWPEGYPDKMQLPKLAVPGETVKISFRLKWPDVLKPCGPHRLVVKESAGHAYHAYRDPWANDWESMPLRHRAIGRLRALRHRDE